MYLSVAGMYVYHMTYDPNPNPILQKWLKFEQVNEVVTLREYLLV